MPVSYVRSYVQCIGLCISVRLNVSLFLFLDWMITCFIINSHCCNSPSSFVFALIWAVSTNKKIDINDSSWFLKAQKTSVAMMSKNHFLHHFISTYSVLGFQSFSSLWLSYIPGTLFVEEFEDRVHLCLDIFLF